MQVADSSWSMPDARSNSKFHQISKSRWKVKAFWSLNAWGIYSSYHPPQMSRESGGRIDIQKVQGKQINVNEESMTTVICGNNTTSKRLAKDTAKVAMWLHVSTRNFQDASGLWPFQKNVRWNSFSSCLDRIICPTPRSSSKTWRQMDSTDSST